MPAYIDDSPLFTLNRAAFAAQFEAERPGESSIQIGARDDIRSPVQILPVIVILS